MSRKRKVNWNDIISPEEMKERFGVMQPWVLTNGDVYMNSDFVVEVLRENYHNILDPNNTVEDSEVAYWKIRNAALTLQDKKHYNMKRKSIYDKVLKDKT